MKSVLPVILLLVVPASGAWGAASGDSLSARIAELRAYDHACTLEPARGELWLDYGRACVRNGRMERARACFERATKCTPADPAAWSALGDAWKADWLIHLDRGALDHGRDCFERATALAPDDAGALGALSALALLRGDPRASLAAGLRANAADPRAVQPMLMLGAALFRLGALALSDSAFRAAESKLDPPLKARVEDEAFAFAGNDPDLTTPENEARLDFLTRCALAFFLFTDQGVLRWDERAALFVRYGPPQSVEFDPAAAQLGWDSELEFHFVPDANRPFYAPSPIGFPYDLQVWHYPTLGMDVALWDRSLTSTYALPYDHGKTLEPVPDPATLAQHAELVALDGGRGVFHAGIPNALPFPVAVATARFPSGGAVRLLASLRADLAADDTVWGAWAVADSAGRVVARETRRLEAPACDPARHRVGSFPVELSPGTYRLDFAAWDSHGRRALQHVRANVDAPTPGPRLSDLVLLCGSAPPSAQADAVTRLEPAFDGVAWGDQLTLYCEIDGLLADPARPARFTYRTTIWALDKGGRRAERPAYQATRVETNAGGHRRQFVTAPIRELGKGAYVLVLAVTDESNASTVERALAFRRG